MNPTGFKGLQVRGRNDLSHYWVGLHDELWRERKEVTQRLNESPVESLPEDDDGWTLRTRRGIGSSWTFGGVRRVVTPYVF